MRADVFQRCLSFAILIASRFESGKRGTRKALQGTRCRKKIGRSGTCICAADCTGQEWEAISAVLHHGGYRFGKDHAVEGKEGELGGEMGRKERKLEFVQKAW